MHHSDYSLFPVRRERIQYWSSHAYTRRPESHSFENVSSAADSAVDENIKLPLLTASILKSLYNFWQHFDTRTASVELAASVVRKDATIQTCFVSHDRILIALNTFKEDFHIGDT